MKINTSLYLYGALLLTLAEAMLWMGLMPLQMDSASAYHPIACLEFPLSYLHTWLEPCANRLDINVHGWFIWPHASLYQGFFPSIFYYPVYWLWSAPNSIFLMNAAYLIIGIYTLARFTRIDWRIATIVFGGNAFVAYMLLHDYALLGSVPLVMFLVPALITTALSAANQWRAIGAGLMAGLLIFIIFETKAVFIYLLPCIALTALAALKDEGFMPTRIWRILPGALLALALAAILLTSTLHGGGIYWKSLIGYSKANADPSPYLLRLWHIIDAYWLRFPNSAAPTYSESPSSAMRLWRGKDDLFLTMPFWICAIWFFWQNLKANAWYRRMALAFAGAAFLHALQLANVYNAYHANHMAPGIFYIVAAVAIAAQGAFSIRRRETAMVLVVLTLLQIACAAHMVSRPVSTRAAPEIMELIDYLDRPDISHKYLVLHVDWGTYYWDSLYGSKEQVVIFKYLIDDNAWKSMSKSALQLNRPIAIVMRRSNKKLLNFFYEHTPSMTQIYPAEADSGSWVIWLVPLESMQDVLSK